MAAGSTVVADLDFERRRPGPPLTGALTRAPVGGSG